MRRIVLLACSVALLAATGTAGAQPDANRSWAAPQIKAVVEAGLLAPSVDAFRAEDALTFGELATVVASFGVEIAVVDPAQPVPLRELDAQLVSAAGLREQAKNLRLTAFYAGLAPKPWLGTETVARLLGLRTNHLRDQEHLELQLDEPATRAEAAFSIARLLELDAAEVEEVRATVESFTLPALGLWQRTLLSRATRLVGSPYVWAGTSERPQQLFGKVMPGGFDCSGLVWRVFKLEPTPGAVALSSVLEGRTSFAMSAEVAPRARITRDELQPADVVFFGSRGPRSKPAEVGHMGIYLGNGWMVHSSDRGTTLTPMTGWYETRFAWGRRPIAEARLS
jgi:hypothetical protein